MDNLPLIAPCAYHQDVEGAAGEAEVAEALGLEGAAAQRQSGGQQLGTGSGGAAGAVLVGGGGTAGAAGDGGGARLCSVRAASAHTGRGLNDGMRWLVEAVKKSSRRVQPRPR